MKTQNQYNLWLMKSFGGKEPKESIYRAVDNLISVSNQNELPVKLSEVAKIIGINPYPIYRNQLYNGELIELNNEFRITLKMKSGKPPSIYWHGYPKMRFTYAHELIHCLHYDFSLSPPKRIAPKAEKKDEEKICNHGAGRLLLPPTILDKYIVELETQNKYEFVRNISKISQTSFQASFLQLINYGYFKCKNKFFLVSALSKGIYKMNIEKPRCIASVLYFDDYKDEFFLPPYKGIEYKNPDWSLIKFYKNNAYNEVEIKNEVIIIKNNKYLVQGKHVRVENREYVWSEFEIIEKV